MVGIASAKSVEQWREGFDMVSTDFNGSPILILSVADVRVVWALMGECVLCGDGDYDKLAEKVEKFLDEIE